MNKEQTKSDLLDVIADTLQRVEQNVSDIRKEINDVKSVQILHAKLISNEENHHYSIEDRMRKLEICNRNLETSNFKLREEFLQLQCHSMKHNLIFGGIENRDGANENTELVLRSFLSKELEMSNIDDISFQDVHRLSERSDGKERNIKARFLKYSDHKQVRKAAAEKLKDKPQFSVYQQYPDEINERRKELIPLMKKLQKQNHDVKLINDKLFVDGQEYIPKTHLRPSLRSPYQFFHRHQRDQDD